MKPPLLATLVFLAFLVPTPLVTGTTIYVDDDNTAGPWYGTLANPYQYIQDGIDAAVSGVDDVQVADGTYKGARNKNLDFAGKAITVKSEYGAGACIIDCEGSGRGFFFYAGEGVTSVADGFTITRGAIAGGAGIFCVGSSPTITGCAITGNAASGNGGGLYCTLGSNATITGCMITGNSADDNGGGIWLWASSPTITNCAISGNTAADSYGGGIYCDDASSPTITNCTISDNTAAYEGGGIDCNNSSDPVITNCTISGNTAAYDGGGSHCYNNSDPAITNCTISGNSATLGYGGGIFCDGTSNSAITNCAISGNTAAWDGGGIELWRSSPTITNCTISGNSAVIGYGGGIDCYDNSSPPITDCTITANSAGEGGGGIYSVWGGSPTIVNCILWGNTAPDGHEIALGTAGDPSTMTVHYSDVQGGQGEVYVESGCSLIWGMGNIDADPLLLPLAGGTLRLSHGSPCIDAGWGDSPAPATDMEGRARWDDPNTPNTGGDMNPPYYNYYDIGAHEFKGYYVDGDIGSNGYDGLAPNVGGGHGPKETIQAGIDAASNGDVVTVAPWTYTGAGNKDLDFANGLAPGQTRHITLTASGGAEVTIIDCQLSGRGFNFHTGEGSRAVVHAFMIINGDSCPGSGGGIYCDGSSPTLINCTISSNTGTYGGGILCTVSSAEIAGCTISGNTATIDGGGVELWGSNPMITSCTITGNSAASGYGGGIDCYLDCNLTISNCTISGNAAAALGGGICCDGSSPTISNCTISGNTATTEGGGIHCRGNSSPTVTNCTISGNSAWDGGGLYTATTTGGPTLTNCILWSDSPNEISGSPAPSVAYCDVQGGWPGTGNIDADPGFVVDMKLMITAQKGDLVYEDFRLRPGSPCIDAGTSDGAPETDMYGRLRYDDPTTPDTGGGPDSFFDIGVHEFKGFYVNDMVGSDLFDGLVPYQTGPSGPKKTIQAAIDFAEPHDTVVVAPGVYAGTGNKDLDFGGEEIVLTSQGGLGTTVIDCGGSGRGFYFHSGETPRAVVMGLGIVNGNVGAGNGGGILCSSYSSPTVLECALIGNAAGSGGGVYCDGSTPTFAGCVIDANQASMNGGGVCVCDEGWVGVDCLIVGNGAGLCGGAIYCDSAAPALQNCTIADNSSASHGGGIECTGTAAPTLTDCILWGDSPNEIHVSLGIPTVEYCDVQGSWPGVGNMNADPEFRVVVRHLNHLDIATYYLSHIAAGQASDSPCIDAGSDTAANLGLDELTTRTDGVPDSATVDMGYHYNNLWEFKITDVEWNQATTSVGLTFTTVPGESYIVEQANADEYAAGLAWTPLAMVTPGATEYTVQDDLTTNPLTHSFRFYRVKHPDGSAYSRQTAAVFELDLDVGFAVRQFFVSTPLLPDPDHASVQDVLSTQLDYPNVKLDRLDADAGLYSRMTYDPDTQTWSGAGFNIVAGEGYMLDVGDAYAFPHTVRLTGYVPAEPVAVSVTRASFAVSVRWMAYSMPRATTLGGLGLETAITPFWEATNEVRLLPLGGVLWQAYRWDGVNWVTQPGGVVSDATPIACGEGILFIHNGVPSQPDVLTWPTWYLQPPNAW